MKKKNHVVLFKSKKDFKRFLLILLAVVVVIQASVMVNNYFLSLPTPPVQPLSLPNIPISLEGYEQVDVKVSPSIIYLTSGCRQLAMVTTDFQTYSIQNGLDKRIDFRPTTHDIFKDMVDNFGMSVKMAKIESLEDSTYYAKLYVQQGSKLLGLDSKPSDSIAVAIRFDAPVYVHKNILEDSGKNIC